MAELLGVWMGGLDGVAWWTRDEEVPCFAASLMKVPLATAAERMAARGELDLDAEVEVHTEFASLVGGRFQLEQDDDQDDDTWGAVGTRVTLRELRRRAVVMSGNLATNLLWEQVGPAEVAAVLDDAGCTSRLTRPIGDYAAREAGHLNVVTAHDWARILCATPSAVEEIMRGQHYREGIPAGLPDGVVIANKTGWVDGITHDIAIVRPADSAPFVLVCLVQGEQTYEEGNATIAQVAADAWGLRR